MIDIVKECSELQVCYEILFKFCVFFLPMIAAESTDWMQKVSDPYIRVSTVEECIIIASQNNIYNANYSIMQNRSFRDVCVIFMKLSPDLLWRARHYHNFKF